MTSAIGPDAELAAGYGALRRSFGARKVPRDVLAVSGPDAAAYLQGQCSQDVAALEVGEQADSLLLAPDGKLVALVRVVRCAPDGYLVDTAGGHGEAVAARLARFLLRAKVEIDARPWSCAGLRGPDAAGALLRALGTGADPLGDPSRAAEHDGRWLLPVAWNGVVGVDILGSDPAALVPGDARWCGSDAWEALRVEAGIPEMGRELDARTIPAEAGLLPRAVSFTKGCYTGQELVARMDARGNRVARRLCGVVIPTDATIAATDGADGTAAGVERLVGAELVVAGGDRPVGAVTSAAWCPGAGGPAALAYVHRSVAVPGSLTLLVPSGSPDGGTVPTPVEARPLPLVAA